MCGFEKSIFSSPSALTRTPQTVKRPVDHFVRAQRNGVSVEPVNMRAKIAADIQNTLHAARKSACHVFNNSHTSGLCLPDVRGVSIGANDRERNRSAQLPLCLIEPPAHSPQPPASRRRSRVTPRATDGALRAMQRA